MIPYSVAYLEMFQQSVRNAAAPLQIPSDDILIEKIFGNPARYRRNLESCLLGSQRYHQYFTVCLN